MEWFLQAQPEDLVWMQARQSLLTPTVHPRLNTETATIDVAMFRGPVTHGKDNQAGDRRGCAALL